MSKIKALTFFSCSSLITWAGTENNIRYLGGSQEMPYVEKDGEFCYFGIREDGGYHLLMVSSKDIAGE